LQQFYFIVHYELYQFLRSISQHKVNLQNGGAIFHLGTRRCFTNEVSPGVTPRVGTVKTENKD
jgi:hypothetical protein